MKKIFTLIAAAFALTANAQEGTFYLQNVESGLYLAGTNSWGTQASVTTEGDEFYIAAAEGGYTITGTTLSSANKTLGYNLFVDTSTSKNGNVWTIDPVAGEDGVYTIYGKGMVETTVVPSGEFEGYIAQSATAGAVTGFVTEGVATVTDAAKWRLVTKADRIAKIKDGDNVSFVFGNPNFTRNHAVDKWIVDEGCTNKNLGGPAKSNGNSNNFCAESYHSPFNIHQSVKDLPNGTYTMTAQGFYRQDGEDAENLPVFYVNDKEVVFPVKAGEEGSMTDASNAFTAGNYTIEPIEFTVTDGTITLGVKNANATLWCIWDNFQVTVKAIDKPAPETVTLTKDMFKTWTSNGADAEPAAVQSSTWCDYVLNESTGMPYGNGNVDWMQYADLTGYQALVVVAPAGTPRFFLNRKTADGQAPDNAIDTNNATHFANYVTKVDNGDGTNTFTLDVAKIVKEQGFAHLNVIKGGNWANVTVASMELVPVNDPTAANAVVAAPAKAKVAKFFKDGKIVVVKDGKMYNVAGQQM